MKPIICAPNFQFVIPGRRSEAEANPESSNHRLGLLDSGFSTLGLRPTVSPRNDEANDSNLEITELASLHQIRMCSFPASGSSWKSFARGGVADTIAHPRTPASVQ